ncbi:hypothetical protein VDGL01_04708 [Verticillium dahliae]
MDILPPAARWYIPRTWMNVVGTTATLPFRALSPAHSFTLAVSLKQEARSMVGESTVLGDKRTGVSARIHTVHGLLFTHGSAAQRLGVTYMCSTMYNALFTFPLLHTPEVDREREHKPPPPLVPGTTVDPCSTDGPPIVHRLTTSMTPCPGLPGKAGCLEAPLGRAGFA